jgi:ABC-type antimicrobial peptide transport system permease subunit
VDRDQPISDVKTMGERRDAALAPEQFQLILIGTFAAIAILLAAAGVYSVISYFVALRTREIGIRMAMGAPPAGILRMIAAETVVLILLGAASGLAGAWALTRFTRSMLYGITQLDSLTFAAAPLFLAMIALVASVGPANRAIRVDPIAALRAE